MNKEEYKEFIKKNDEQNKTLELTSTINAITHILVAKGICTMGEIKRVKEKYQNKMLEESFNKEDKETLKAIKSLNDLFGGLF